MPLILFLMSLFSGEPSCDPAAPGYVCNVEPSDEEPTYPAPVDESM